MVNNEKKLFFEGLKKPTYINKKRSKIFLKISNDYPFFSPAHVINLLLSKKYKSISL